MENETKNDILAAMRVPLAAQESDVPKGTKFEELEGEFSGSEYKELYYSITKGKRKCKELYLPITKVERKNAQQDNHD